MTIQNSEARLLVDEKIECHPSGLQRGQLKSQNAPAPISNLPPEILSAIFDVLSAERSECLLPLPCYHFTQVSRLWRHVALSTPKLWQVVITTSTPWATTFLERSKGADLTVIQPSINLDPIPARISFLKHVLENHTSRIRHLELAETDPPSLASLFEHVRPLSLRLHSLKLDCIFRHSAATFPSGIIDTQCLRTLDIDRCEGPWYSLSFPALTSLRLYHISNPLCLSKFLDMLRGLGPRLTSLDMGESFPLTRDSVGGSIDSVNLPNLRFFGLRLTGERMEVPNILHILSSIIVPPTAAVEIYLKDTTHQGGILTALTPSFRKFFSHFGHHTVYRNLDVKSLGIPILCLQARQNDECVSPTPDLQLVLNLLPTELWTSRNPLQPILHSLPLSNITTLTLNVSSYDFVPLDTLGRLPCLETVVVFGGHALDFFNALTYKPNNYNTEPSAYYSVAFPALQSLWIKRFWFDADSVEKLLDCLIERSERRAGLWDLNLSDSFCLCPEDVAVLREIVVNVEWA